MTMKRLRCRTHGGYFTVPARRGRPPVNCTEENECDAAKVPSTKPRTTVPSRTEAAPKMRTSVATAAHESASVTPDRANWSERRQATVRETNRVFGELTSLGWEAKRGWMDKDSAEITATRGEEMIYIVVRFGGVIAQKYSLWSFEKPSVNKKPVSKLPFDPDEIGDRELSRMLVGMKVTWHNRLSGREETAYCGKDSVRIEHCFDGKGDEVPGQRIVKFIDATGRGFGAFQLDALIKVG